MLKARQFKTARRYRHGLTIFCIAIVVWYISPLFEEPLAWPSTRDWGYFLFLEEVTNKSILEFGEFPLWNPYYYGGAEHLANPQTTILSPTTLVTLTLGVVLGMKACVLFFAFAGFFGMQKFTRYLGGEFSAACAGGLMYGCSGWYAHHSGGGHWSFIVTMLYPWAALYFLKALDRPKYWIGAIICSVWVAFHWGIYTIPWLFMILFVLAVWQSWERKSLKPIGSYFALGGITFGLSAIRMLPVLEYVRAFPRTVEDWDRLSFDDLLTVLVSRRTERDYLDHQWVWPEYSNYIGIAGLLLLALALFYKYPKKRMLWIGAWIFVSLFFGNWEKPAPYALMKELPIYENLRVSARYSLMALFFVAPAIGLALYSLIRSLRRRNSLMFRVLALALSTIAIAALLIDPITFNREQFKQSFHEAKPDDRVWPKFVQKSGGPWRMYAYPPSNQGSVMGIEESPIPTSPFIRLDAEEQFLLTVDSVGRAEETYWSPNRLSFYVESTEPNQLVINQNYRAQWKVNNGWDVVDHKGLLAVNVPPGKWNVYLKYLPNSFLLGALISFLSLISLIIWYLSVAMRSIRQ